MNEFTKAEGSGNDFIIIDNRARALADPAAAARRLCPRRTAVGADGLLLLENSSRAPFRMRIINADGSEAEMCGNGLRCFIVYLVAAGLAEAGQWCEIETGAGRRAARARGDQASVSLGRPAGLETGINLTLPDRAVRVGTVNTGVPHVVLPVDDLEGAPVVETGRLIRHHRRFAPAGTNVNFTRVRDGRIHIRTYERGVEDETLSCGTGTVAAAVVLSRAGAVSLPVEVVAASGETLTVSAADGEFFLGGRARLVYRGRLGPEYRDA